ncbi:MAG: molybdopterin-dependent oxidoreductase [Chloroflexi bacterium]|nr:molybdopterin-dependent oxidoreductase [Chloroflexota bacterium]
MSRMRWLLVGVLLIAALAGCQQAPAATAIVEYVVVTATPEPATPAPTVAPVTIDATLALRNADTSQTLDYAAIKALPVTEGWAGTKSSTGHITPPEYYRGVSIKDLCELIGPFDDTMAVNVVAKDGYAMTMSYDQIVNGTFVTFDPATGDEVVREDKLTVIVAYERDGEPLPVEADGSLRLYVVGGDKNQVTDGHWSVKWVREVIIKSAAADWTLHLEGALVEEMDRGTFESGSAPNCHLSEWADADGNMWAGIPLYYLLGRVDDDNKHETGAFNAELAGQGYQVDVVAADGYRVTFDSKTLSRNTTVILAFMMNGQPLGDEYFPLRLVGSSLKKAEMVGAVAQIVLHLDAAPAAAPTEPPAQSDTPAVAPEVTEGTLHIWGKVATPWAVTAADFAQLNSVEVTTEHPKKGEQTYKGVLLNEILAKCDPAEGATTVLFTAGDGYTAEVPLADVVASAESLVTLDETTFSLVMPGMDSGAWVKDVRLVEVK